eukprot:3540527-Pyramimonas_sp.AAC.1
MPPFHPLHHNPIPFPSFVRSHPYPSIVPELAETADPIISHRTQCPGHSAQSKPSFGASVNPELLPRGGRGRERRGAPP